MSDKNKMTKGQIVRMIFSIFGAAVVFAGGLIGIFFNWLPDSWGALSIPLMIVGIAILLILKTTGKPYIQITPPTDIEGDDTDEVAESEEQVEKAAEEEKEKEKENTVEDIKK